jgi:hypothetical protein
MYVDVARALDALAQPRTRPIRSGKKATALAEATALRPPSATAEVKLTVGDAQLDECFARSRGVAYVDRLEALDRQKWPGFATALHAPFKAGLNLDRGANLLVDLARIFLRRLELSPDEWLGVVVAAVVAENNPVLDFAVARAHGATGFSTASAYGEAWRSSGNESMAVRLEQALARCS